MRPDPSSPLSVPDRRPLTALLLAAVLALAAVLPAGAQVPEAPVIEPEAPATLLPLKIGDAGVDISLAGSWTASASYGFGSLLVPGGQPRSLDGFPGIALGPAFSQVPDLSLSLTMLERWFIELSILGGFDANSLLMGYRGVGDEPVRHVLLGTRDITVAATPFLETPAQTAGSLGLSALVVSGIGTNEAMIRWDATGERRRTYLGADELLEERIGLEAWIRGRFFVLPDEGVEDLVVLLEDPAGTLVPNPPDGRTYRQAGPADAILDAVAGRVTLKAAWKGRVLVFYHKGGLAVGTDDAGLGVDALPGETGGLRDLTALKVRFYFDMPDYLGEDMNLRAVDVPGVGVCLLLWEPGDLTPFQAANAYAFTFAPPADPARLRAFLEPKVTGAEPPQPILFLADRDLKVVSLLVDRDFRSQGRNWYPFWESPADDPVNLLYGPKRDSLAGLLDLELVVQSLQKVDGYVLGSDVVPSSVRVTVNGLEERRFEFDGATGRITFQVEIAPSDRTEVRWRTADAAAGGDLLLTWRDDVRLAEDLGLWVAAGLRWNVGSGLTAGEPYARSGALVAAAGLEGTLEGAAGRLSWSVEAAGSFMNPDTTGVVRLHGMEGDSLAVDLSEELAWPSSPPADVTGWDYDVVPTRLNRGKLLYRDYRSYDAFGGAVLHDIDWPDAVLTDYANGGRPGPYEVFGSSAGSTAGKSLVLEYDLSAGEWVGTQVPVVAGNLADLSTAKSLSVRMRSTDPLGSFVHVEVGAIGEDLDDDDVLDAEPSTTSTGFAFDDTGNGVALKVGAGPRLEGNGQQDTEDRDGNGMLTPEDSRRVATWNEVTVGSAWQVFTFPLDDADRAKLEQARAIRITVESVGGAAGRLLIDQVSVAGAAFWVDLPGTATVREVAEPDSADDPGPGNRLVDVQADAMRLFHPAGEAQEVLEIGWTGAATDITTTGYTAKTTGGIVYDEAVLYVRGVNVLPGSGVTVAFSLLDADGRGVRWSLDAAVLADEAWHEVRASRADGAVTLDGVVQPGTATFDAVHGELARLRVVVSGSTDGILYLDEVHLREPRAAFGAGIQAEASWSRPGAVWQPGGVAVLANLDVVQRLSALTAGFATLYGVPSAVTDVTSRTGIGIDVLYARLAADVVLRWVDGSFVGSGGHRLTIPAAASPVTLSDSFSLAGTGEFSRSDSLRIRPSERLSVGIEARATGTAQALDQSWTAALALQPLDRLDLGLDLLVSQSSTGYALADAWYGARWAREAALLAPWIDGAALERVERLSAQLGAGWGAFEGEISLAGSATGSAYDALGRAQEDRIDQAWSVSWSSREGTPDEVVVTLQYARSLSMAGPRGAGEPFTDEAAEFFALLGDQRWYLLGLPVVEIFLDDTDRVLAAWAGLEKASWRPSLKLTLERRSGSRLSDLFVPSGVELTLDRALERRGDLPQNTITIRPRLVTHALNLFGRLGSHPVADFYRTDEFRIALSATMAGARAAELGLSEMGLELYAEFLGFREQSLTVVNVFTLGEDAKQATDDLQASFAWATHPAGGVRVPYLPVEIAKTGYLEHRESLDLDLATGGEPAHPLTLLLGHETSLEYPDRGSLKAGLKAGFDIESLAGSYALRFAFEASIEAKITF
jgi:hypothetical protein